MALEVPQEYLEHVEKTVSWIEKLGDAFSGTDERLDFIVQQIAELQLQEPIATLKLQVVALTDALKATGIEVEMPREIREIRIQQNVLARQALILNQAPPFDGRIREVKIHWPPGCAGLVAVRVGYRTKQFCPFEGFLSLDNVTPTFPLDEAIQHTEKLWIEIQNADAVNNHNITVMFNIEEVTQ